LFGADIIRFLVALGGWKARGGAGIKGSHPERTVATHIQHTELYWVGAGAVVAVIGTGRALRR
jgi:hypothetical protein